jgi:hypothetical protein
VRVYFDAVSDSAPPHATVFKRDPHVLAGGVQKAAQRIEVPGTSPTMSKLVFDHLLNEGKIRVYQKLTWNIRPPGVDLLVGFGGGLPLPARTVFHIANGCVWKA